MSGGELTKKMHFALPWSQPILLLYFVGENLYLETGLRVQVKCRCESA